ncbi:MAG: hypothetical protein VKJ64_21715 [Leptolyngbyaceae bacterium]|nr:hypothetical protein [Leptolyngbyaceae bacterium]
MATAQPVAQLVAQLAAQLDNAIAPSLISPLSYKRHSENKDGAIVAILGY